MVIFFVLGASIIKCLYNTFVHNQYTVNKKQIVCSKVQVSEWSFAKVDGGNYSIVNLFINEYTY